MQGSCINVMRSALGPRGVHPRQEEVAMSLEAVAGAVQVSGRPWQMQRRKRRDSAAPLIAAHSMARHLLRPCDVLLQDA